MMEEQYIVFLSKLNQVCIGELDTQSSEGYTVKNPCIIAVQPSDSQENKLNFALYPIFYKELLDDRSGDAKVFYKNNEITLTDIGEKISSVVISHYRKLVDAYQPNDTNNDIIKF